MERRLEPHQIIDRGRKARGLSLRALGLLFARSLGWAQQVCDGTLIPPIAQAQELADALHLSAPARRMLVEGVTRLRLQRSEGITEAEADVLARVAGSLTGGA